MATVDDAKRSPAPVVESDVVCVFCPCLCDDVELHIESDRIIEAKNACQRGRQEFLAIGPEDGPTCWIEGRPATLEEGVDRAAAILSAARYPLIFGLGDATCEAQRAAVSLGDRVGACIDTATADRHAESTMALQSVGEVTCTLGEIKHRGDLVIVWGSDPVSSHPRLLERYALDPIGAFVPGGRSDRYCIVVIPEETETVREAADEWISVRSGADFEALWTLRAILKGVNLDSDAIQGVTGISLERWAALIDRMKAAKYGVLLYGSEDLEPSGPSIGSAAHALVRDLNAHTRFVVMPLSKSVNDHGARNVLAWQTGYPFAVSLAGDSPRYGPGEFTASDLLERGEADAAVVVSGEPSVRLGPKGLEHLSRIPRIVLASRAEENTTAATVAFRTAEFGVRTRGTVFRMDGVALPLRAVLLTSLPQAEMVLNAIERRLIPDAARAMSHPTEAHPSCP